MPDTLIDLLKCCDYVENIIAGYAISWKGDYACFVLTTDAQASWPADSSSAIAIILLILLLVCCSLLTGRSYFQGN